jgi:two-component system, chemotaxis family, sensor kinase CheA
VSAARDKLLAQFRQLVAERTGRVTQELTKLDAGAPSTETKKAGEGALRDLHGLKGESRMMGFAQMNDLIHAMESVLKSAAVNHYQLDASAVDALLSCCDSLQVMCSAREGANPDLPSLLKWLQSLEFVSQQSSSSRSRAPFSIGSKETEPTAPKTEPLALPSDAPSKTGQQVLKFSAEQMQLLSDGITTVFQRLRGRDALESQHRMLARELKALTRMAESLGTSGEPIVRRTSQLRDQAASLNRQSLMLLSSDSLELTQLQELLAQMRLSSVSVLFEMVPRLVRDLARDLGKEVDVRLEGEDTRVDRNVLEALREPLLHLIRNAIDHGLELPEVRRQSKKTARGTMTVAARRDGDRLLLEVSDDGRGLSRDAILSKAVSAGLVASGAVLNDADLYELLFRSGFSTKEETTDLSGRGVGLDAVRNAVLSLGGEVEVRSQHTVSTTFSLRVPVSLAASSVVFVRSGSHELGFPTAQVVRAFAVDANSISLVLHKHSVSIPEGTVPFASLGFLLGEEPKRAARPEELALLIKGRGQWAALGIDELLEERMQPLMPVNGMMQSLKHISGAAMRTDGALRLIFSVPEVVAAAAAQSALAPVQHAISKSKRRALVVDDSPLTRELLVAMMEAAGFEVVEAIDGRAALLALETEQVEIVVSDLEMPNLNGVELTRAIKSNVKLKKLPVVLVTTRGSDEDKKSGLLAGAGAYITKTDMVRRDLLEAVARLLS